MSTANTSPDPRPLLVQASHILHHHGILDGFGHVSVRDPSAPNTFFQTGLAAALITKPEDFTTYSIHDGSIVETNTQPGSSKPRISPYSEHYIHAAIYARFPDVMSVVHSHARDVLPYTIAVEDPNVVQQGTLIKNNQHPLQSCIHTAAFLGKGPPVWDIAHAYEQKHVSDKRHLLVNDYTLGSSLASAAVRSPDDSSAGRSWKEVVLQRGHGFVTLGVTIQEAVYNAIYTVENAKVLSQALQLCSGNPDQVRFLDKEIEACSEMDRDCIPKVWPLWLKQIEKDGFWS